MPDPVTHSFQAEVSQVLRLVIHSLYSNKEIFLRELVSNASDALDKLRFRALTEPDLYEGDTSLRIRLHADKVQGTLTIEDNGVGMNEAALVKDLGTVAHSGSRAFLEQLAQTQGAQKDARLIGQFGVGFYSAYLVADRVEVVSRAAGKGETAHRWISEAKDTFTVEAAERAERGTAITLFLRDDQKEFLEEWRLRELIGRYSDYVGHPIELLVRRPAPGAEDGDEGAAEGEKSAASEPKEVEAYERVNKASALWQRPKSDISDEQYDEFYHHLSHGTEAPAARVHFKVEGAQEFVGLLYVPKERPFELRLGQKPRGIRLYVKRVLIMESCDEIAPEWLRFVVGIVDSDDLPLNVSREILQESATTRTIKKQVVKQVLDALEAMASDRPDDYRTFWENFGAFVKEGLATDYENQARLAKLVRASSTHRGEGPALTSFAEYVSRMPAGQPAIYYAIGESQKALEGAPHLEGLKKRGYEVLLLTEPIDEWAFESLRTFEGKALVSAMRADLKIEASAEEKKTQESDAGAVAPLLGKLREVLGSRVDEVRASDRLIDSPVCLVQKGGPHAYVQRLLREAGRDVPKGSRIFEVNPTHPLIQRLNALAAPNGDPKGDLAEWIEVLFDQALLTEGASLEDPGGFAKRVTSLLSRVTA